jgi:hypothetical protein
MEVRTSQQGFVALNAQHHLNLKMIQCASGANVTRPAPLSLGKNEFRVREGTVYEQLGSDEWPLWAPRGPVVDNYAPTLPKTRESEQLKLESDPADGEFYFKIVSPAKGSWPDPNLIWECQLAKSFLASASKGRHSQLHWKRIQQTGVLSAFQARCRSECSHPRL